MATELLHTTNDTLVWHTPAHNLKSFVYLLCWIITLYNGPKSQLCSDSSKKLALEGWYEGNDLAIFANNKEGCMLSNSHLNDITNYYIKLSPCIAVLSSLVHEQHQHNHRTRESTPVNYLTGSKYPHSVKDPVLFNYNMVISILCHTCLYLNNEELSEKDITTFQLFFLTKKDYTHLVSGEEISVCSSTNILDLGGSCYSKKGEFCIVYEVPRQCNLMYIFYVSTLHIFVSGFQNFVAKFCQPSQVTNEVKSFMQYHICEQFVSNQVMDRLEVGI